MNAGWKGMGWVWFLQDVAVHALASSICSERTLFSYNSYIWCHTSVHSHLACKPIWAIMWEVPEESLQQLVSDSVSVWLQLRSFLFPCVSLCSNKQSSAGLSGQCFGLWRLLGSFLPLYTKSCCQCCSWNYPVSHLLLSFPTLPCPSTPCPSFFFFFFPVCAPPALCVSPAVSLMIPVTTWCEPGLLCPSRSTDHLPQTTAGTTPWFS